MNIRIAAIKFLKYCDKNGIRRMYEVFPEWVKLNYPKLYKIVPEFQQLEKVLHKNSHEYRGLPNDKKAKIKSLRTTIYNQIAKKVARDKSCLTCSTLIILNFEGKIPCSFRTAISSRTYCSLKCAANSKELKEKKATTNLARYGSTCSLNGPDQIKAKQATWKRNYGVTNPSHSPEVVGKILEKRYGRRTIELGGKVFQFQGYEDVLLQYLNRKGIKSSQFTTEPNRIGMFEYTYSGQVKKYLPDAKVKLPNGEIWYLEVKSLLTLNSTRAIRDRVIAKAKFMWGTHDKNYRIFLCSHKKIISIIANMKDLLKLMNHYQQW